MLRHRPSNERGHANFGWLDSYHTFSFGEYYDPRHIHFRTLRVINEDVIAPGMGFGTHPHQDMEILTYVISGEIEHKDSMGNQFIIPEGHIQIMSAGTGIFHSEYNPSQTKPLHLYQIWMLPQKKGLTPRYNDADIRQTAQNEWICIGHPTPTPFGVQIMQDIRLYLGKWEANTHTKLPIPATRFGWLQVIKGEGILNNLTIKQGDGVAISKEELVTLQATTPMDVLLFDLA